MVNRGSTAIGLHQQDRVAQTGGRQVVVQRLQVRHDLRRERRVDHRRGGPLVLAHQRRHGCRRGHPVAAPLLAHRLGRGLLVCVVDEGVHEGDSHGLHAVAVESVEDVAEAVQVERSVLGAVGVDAARHRGPQIAGHQHGGVGSPVIPLVLAQPAADLERVTEAIGADQADGGAGSLQHRVGGHRGAVHEQRAVGQHLIERQARFDRDACQCGMHTTARVGRYRRHFRHPGVAVVIGQHEVGKGAPDVHADAPRCHRPSLRAVAPTGGAVGARRGRGLAHPPSLAALPNPQLVQSSIGVQPAAIALAVGVPRR